MARDPSGVSRRHLRTLFDAGVTTGLTDGQLLERFATRRGDAAESAFAALVERHAGVVYSSALRQTRNRQHAEDVTQAVFLILSQKAAAIAGRSVASL